MAGAMYGADAEELEAIARELDGYEQELGQLLLEGVGAVSLVGMSATLGSIWRGPRSDEFAALWQSRHLARVRGVQAVLADAAGALRANAAEQTAASGGDGPTVGAQPSPGPAGPSQGGGATGEVGPDPSDDQGPAPTPPTGELPGTHRSKEEVAAAYRENWTGYGLYSQGADGGSLDYECVAWAWFRMKELGYEPGTISGNGGPLAGNLGGTTDTVPAPGAVMSYPWKTYGHVMIAEEVYRDADGVLTVRVSEMNTEISGRSVAEEYRSDRVLKQNADGTWHIWGENLPVTVFNPEYGTPRI